jgi:hypothetical protein
MNIPGPPSDGGDRGALNPAQPENNSEKQLSLRTLMVPSGGAARRYSSQA